MEIGSVEEGTKVGGVWMIAQVRVEDVQEEWKVARSRKNWRKERQTEKARTVEKEKYEKDDAGNVDVPEVKYICAVSEAARWQLVGAGEITVDSAAEESVCPQAWGEMYQMQ